MIYVEDGLGLDSDGHYVCLNLDNVVYSGEDQMLGRIVAKESSLLLRTLVLYDVHASVMALLSMTRMCSSFLDLFTPIHHNPSYEPVTGSFCTVHRYQPTIPCS